MRVRRLPVGLIIPAFLIGLVGLLATLQYQWLGQVSEAEREQLRRSLSQRAREFADDFDREISHAYLELQLSRDAMAARDWSEFATAFDRWRTTARYPQMITAIYLAESVDGRQQSLRRYDSGTRVFADVPLPVWPSQLEPVRRQLALPAGPPPLPSADGRPARPVATSGPTAQFYAFAMMAVNVDVPALIIPVTNARAGQTSDSAASADAR